MWNESVAVVAADAKDEAELVGGTGGSATPNPHVTRGRTLYKALVKVWSASCLRRAHPRRGMVGTDDAFSTEDFWSGWGAASQH